MINRAILLSHNKSFDFFNDYDNTYNWLISQGYISFALHLERRKQKEHAYREQNNSTRVNS